MDIRALHKITYGLFLLVSQQDGKDNASIINTAVQVAEKPNRIIISVIKDTLTCQMILSSGKFNICALTKGTEFDFFKHFGMQSGRDTDKFENAKNFKRSANGLYYLKQHSNMYISAEVLEKIDLGDHVLFIAQVSDAEVLSDEEPCTYALYHSHIKPKPQSTSKKQWVCKICGYVYEGEELPEDFVCPLCKHGKEDFEAV